MELESISITNGSNNYSHVEGFFIVSMMKDLSLCQKFFFYGFLQHCLVCESERVRISVKDTSTLKLRFGLKLLV